MKFDRSLFIGKFSVEAEENLQKLNDGVLRLERGEADANPSTPAGQELMADILRAAHTLKGSARMMGFKDINEVARKLEDLLLEVKESRVVATPAVCDLIFRSLDVIDASRQAVVDGREESVAVDEIVALLERAAQGETVELPPRAAAPAAAVVPEAEPPAGPPPAMPAEDVARGNGGRAEAPAPTAAEPAPAPAEPAVPPGVPRATAMPPARVDRPAGAQPHVVEERIR